MCCYHVSQVCAKSRTGWKRKTKAETRSLKVQKVESVNSRQGEKSEMRNKK